MCKVKSVSDKMWKFSRHTTDKWEADNRPWPCTWKWISPWQWRVVGLRLKDASRHQNWQREKKISFHVAFTHSNGLQTSAKDEVRKWNTHFREKLPRWTWEWARSPLPQLPFLLPLFFSLLDVVVSFRLVATFFFFLFLLLFSYLTNIIIHKNFFSLLLLSFARAS